MKIYVCKECGSIDVFLRKHGPHLGLYCGDCGAWIKWINKSEKQLVERFIKENKIQKNESEEIRMAKVTAKRTGTKVTTGEVRLSYAHLFEPHAIEGNEPKYSVSVIIPKSDKATLKAIKEAVEQAKEDGKSKWNGKVPNNLKTPLRDGDVEREDDEAYAGCYFLNANSKNKPGIVDINVHPILDQSEVYSGCYARLTLNFYAYNANGNKGVAAGLGNVQKLRDGEPLGGISRAEDDFESLSDDNEDDFLG